MKTLRHIGMSAFVLLMTSITVSAQKYEDLSGDWIFKSGDNPYRVATIQIKQAGPELQLTEKYQPKQKKGDRVLTYYSDGRGETNMAADGLTELKSRSKWTGDTFFTLFEKPLKQTGRISGRQDEWELSKDGRTLTIKTTFITDPPSLPVSPSLYGRRGLTVKTFKSTRKRVFKKLN